MGCLAFRWARLTPYDFVRVALAAILLVAAGLKCHQLATSPVLGDGLLDSRWLLMATVEFELFFGLWLLANLLPSWTHRAAVLCFGLFAAVSLYKALSGHASCGCFGRVEVNPWYTFTLDAAAVLSLLHWYPSGASFSSLVPSQGVVLRATAITLAWLSVGVPAALAMAIYQPAVLAEDGIILGDGNVVILEPEKWTGKRFPLLPFVGNAPDVVQVGQHSLRELLAKGEWVVLLYHHDCPICQEIISRYERRSCHSAIGPESPRVALVEMPPYGDASGGSAVPGSACLRGRLSDAKEWFAEAPIVVELRQGLVTRVRGREQLAPKPTDTPAIAQAAGNRSHPGEQRRGGLVGEVGLDGGGEAVEGVAMLLTVTSLAR
ncbi:MAG: hypothetical protein NTW96_24350 [Planctomycetia bacterium]|nr:hypothetical protein [Planctomycetia bacterium]